MTSVGNDNGDETPLALEEAAEWLLLLREQPQDADLCRRFEAWRAQSATHRAAWDRTTAMWGALGAASDQYERLSPARDETPGRRTGAHGSRSSRPAWRGLNTRPKLAAAAAVLSICVALVFAPAILLRLQADEMTTTAETRTVQLEDGSTVVLAADTAIRSAFADSGRKVTLLAGEAFFEVVPDGRTFVVSAGSVEVEVLGTAFDVRMTSAGTEVALARGLVMTRFGDAMRSQATLNPGDVISIDHASGAGTRATIAESDVARWREGRLLVTNETIGTVVEIIQRYHPAWITLPDRALSTRRVSGIYDLTNPDQALRALVGPYGGKVRSLSPLLRVVSRL
ncbi:FecR family protein [Ensifer sp.]|jgi:transmembrane sensor|uniref:FecR family protein n=1 Tax=Ensifer sp. TaxID=1872086 RepID=UPI002E121F16|nr:FecR family protein [Ensifer sp.]